MTHSRQVPTKPVNQPILAFFPGSHTPNKTDNKPFPLLHKWINLPKENVVDHDGCSVNNKVDRCGLFAFGIEDLGDELLNKIIARRKEFPAENITLVVEAQSRGCLSALALAKKIQNNPELRDEVNVILNLRDPVPGNFSATAKIDAAELTVAKQHFDLTSCTCIKEVNMTVLEQGNLLPKTGMPIPGYDVLVPKFAKTTKLEVEYLPGSHMISERRDLSNIKYNPDAQIYEGHPLIALLILLKSLQVYKENEIDIDWNQVIKDLRDINAQYFLINESEISNTPNAQFTTFHSNFSTVLERFATNGFRTNFLINSQNEIYNSLLNEFKENKVTLKRVRDIHFGGKFGATASDPQHANCLNMRHERIKNKVNKKAEGEDYYPRPLFGFKPFSPRIDLNDVNSIIVPEVCGAILLGSNADINAAKSKMNSNAAYVCHNNKIFYINKSHDECIDLKVDETDFKKFTKTFFTKTRNKTLSKAELEEAAAIIKCPLPFNKFYQPYQRIMLILDQQIKSDLLIPGSAPLKKYIDDLKEKLKKIAIDQAASELQKKLAMEKLIFTVYKEVKLNEGQFPSRLRKGLEGIMSAPGLLNLKDTYGIDFRVNHNEDQEKLARAKENLLSSMDIKYKNIAEKEPAFYRHCIKFLIKLNEVTTSRIEQKSELFKAVNDLLIKANAALTNPHDDLSNGSTDVLSQLKLIIFSTYNKIRASEGNKWLAHFHSSSYLGNFLEKFMKRELGMVDVLHEYDNAKFSDYEKILSSQVTQKSIKRQGNQNIDGGP